MKLSRSAPTGAAFLLAQLGAHAADRFAERIAILGISPPHAGILRMIGAEPSHNQLSLGRKLGVFPSRMVILIDQLVDKGLVERKRSQTDRRQSMLVLTKKGTHVLERLSALAAEHESDLCAALTNDERNTLASLCRKIAAQLGLAPGVHPGYRKL